MPTCHECDGPLGLNMSCGNCEAYESGRADMELERRARALGALDAQEDEEGEDA